MANVYFWWFLKFFKSIVRKEMLTGMNRVTEYIFKIRMNITTIYNLHKLVEIIYKRH